MSLILLCQFTAQHFSDVNTSILRSLLLLVALLCRLTWGVLVLCSGIGCWWCGIRMSSGSTCIHQQPIPLHNTNTPQVSLHNNATSSRKLLRMDVLTSETCWAVNWHNRASVIKLVNLYSNIKLMHGPISIRSNNSVWSLSYRRGCKGCGQALSVIRPPCSVER